MGPERVSPVGGTRADIARIVLRAGPERVNVPAAPLTRLITERTLCVARAASPCPLTRRERTNRNNSFSLWREKAGVRAGSPFTHNAG